VRVVVSRCDIGDVGEVDPRGVRSGQVEIVLLGGKIKGSARVLHWTLLKAHTPTPTLVRFQTLRFSGSQNFRQSERRDLIRQGLRPNPKGRKTNIDYRVREHPTETEMEAPGRTEGVRKIAKRFGVDPGTVQRISRPFESVSIAA